MDVYYVLLGIYAWNVAGVFILTEEEYIRRCKFEFVLASLKQIHSFVFVRATCSVFSLICGNPPYVRRSDE